MPGNSTGGMTGKPSGGASSGSRLLPDTRR
jgi:hypothetical protein